MVGYQHRDEHGGFVLPFGYYLQRDKDVLTLYRADGSDVATFGVVDLDRFDVEFAVWEDAD